MNTWEELDVHVASDIASMNAQNGMLKSHILVLLAKNVIGSQTPVDVVRQRLTAKFDIHYALSDVVTEMAILLHEEEHADSNVLITEDYFEGC